MEFRRISYTKESSFLSPEENIAVIKLNRPEVSNTLSKDMLLEIDSALEETRRDGQARVVVLSAEGEKAFCAGIDPNEPNPQDAERLAEQIFKKIEEFGKPIIAAVAGEVSGHGVGVALACDMRVAAENARIQNPTDVARRLAEIVGRPNAADVLFSGRAIDAKEAENMGLVNKVVPTDELATTVNWTAGKIASSAPLAVQLSKRCVNKSFEVSIVEGNKLELDAILQCARTEDLREGIKAVFEKRTPQFKGK